MGQVERSVELAPAGITVNCVAPGYTQKDAAGHSALSEEAWQKAIGKIPIGRIGLPDDAAALMGRVNQMLEAWIRERPEQWLWPHNRWPKEAHEARDDTVL